MEELTENERDYILADIQNTFEIALDSIVLKYEKELTEEVSNDER